MTDFSQTEDPQATPGTAGAVAPPPAELSEQRVGGGALMQRLSDGEAA